jgi:predicted DNA binding CopG/RHH family protein
VSAFCCTGEARNVSGEGISARRPSITARPTLQEKRRFTALAAARRISESALALIAIRDLLKSTAPISQLAAMSAREPAIDRITIRLRPGDRRAVRQRAAQRGMKDSAYLAAVVRAHVAASPLLPANELAQLKLAVTVLAGFGRLLARTAREAREAGVMHRDLQQDLSHTRALVATLEQRTHDLARAALVSWESSVD